MQAKVWENEVSKMKHAIKLGVQYLGLSLVLYIATYFLLMNRSVPAVNEYGQVVFKSSFRLGPIRRGQQHTILGTGPCWENYLFWPADFAWRAIVPQRESEVRQPTGN